MQRKGEPEERSESEDLQRKGNRDPALPDHAPHTARCGRHSPGSLVETGYKKGYDEGGSVNTLTSERVDPARLWKCPAHDYGRS
jgi:hypothetical protein